MLKTRTVAGNDSAFSYVRLKYGDLATDTVTGVIIYPDDFSFAEAGVGMLPFGAKYAISEIDVTTWEALEESGCVFLPATGYGAVNEGTAAFQQANLGQLQFYWASTAVSANAAAVMYFHFLIKDIYYENENGRQNSFPVRLAQDL